MTLAPYRKVAVAVLMAALTALAAALTDDHVTRGEMVGVVLAVLTALGVYVAPNDPPPDQPKG